jgi:hypothetical protein
MAIVRAIQRATNLAALQKFLIEQKEDKASGQVPPDSNTFIASGSGASNTTVTTTPAPSDGLIITRPDGSKIANIPTVTTHWYWDSWAVEVKEIPIDNTELNKLIVTLQTSSIQLASRITKFDNSSTYTLNIITLTTGILGVILTAIAPESTISDTTKQTAQVTISAITAGFSLFSNALSKGLQPVRDQAVEYKGDVDEILTIISAPTPKPK